MKALKLQLSQKEVPAREGIWVLPKRQDPFLYPEETKTVKCWTVDVEGRFTDNFCPGMHPVKSMPESDEFQLNVIELELTGLLLERLITDGQTEKNLLRQIQERWESMNARMPYDRSIHSK